ncbi:MAG TPA: YqgE/AlgH family protein [Terriglobales bacterium]|nr:YqgE/AlgH family protein [Terriglobales bacterium]
MRFVSLIGVLCLLSPLAAAQSHQPKDLAVGKLLAASSQVPDARFHQAVVLVISQTNQGTVGLVLNHLGDPSLASLFPGVASAQGRSDHAYVGGPVQATRIFCLLHLPGRLREAQPVLPGIFVSDSQNLMQLALNARQPASSFRVFQGYAGWSPEQIARELAAGMWTIFPGSAPVIFDPDPATLWSRLTAPTPAKR